RHQHARLRADRRGGGGDGVPGELGGHRAGRARAPVAVRGDARGGARGRQAAAQHVMGDAGLETPGGPAEIYRRALERRSFASDPAQLRAVERLQRLYEEWSAYKARRSTALRRLVVRPPLPRGVYFWG